MDHFIAFIAAFGLLLLGVYVVTHILWIMAILALAITAAFAAVRALSRWQDRTPLPLPWASREP